MKKHKILLCLLASFLCACTFNNSIDQIEENEYQQDDKSSVQLEFRTLKVDGRCKQENQGDINYTYLSWFESPILITKSEGITQIASQYEDFYQARSEYLNEVDLSKNNILLLTLNTVTSFYDFQPLQLTAKGDTLEIYYHMDGEGKREEKLKSLTHAIIEVPILNERIEKVAMRSDDREWEYDKLIQRM